MTTVLESLNSALHKAFAADEAVYLLGEDVLDPYGGAFKVSRGLSTAYPERVLTTPVSEAGIVGVGAGMSLRGLRPVVEIMFGDFLTLAADQLINHVAKFRWMYNDQVRVPIVIRTPMGGRRGYGPTHSQTLEKLFLGVPNLCVLAPSAIGNPGDLLKHAILTEENPVLFVEHKLLYQVSVLELASISEFSVEPYSPDRSSEQTPPTAYTLSILGAPAPDLTLIAYGYMAELARQALQKLAYEKEIFAELVVQTQLAPFDIAPLLVSLERTGKLLAVEEGTLTMGWGSEVIARAVEVLDKPLSGIKRLAAMDIPVPASGALESAMLPDVDDIVQTAQEMV